MADTTTLNESFRAPLDGTESIRLATSGANWKAQVNQPNNGGVAWPWGTVAGGTAASSSLILESTTGAGTSDNIVFKTASQTERQQIDTTGQVIINNPGNTSPASGSLLTVHTIDGVGKALQASQWSADTNDPFIAFQKSRGATVGTNTRVNLNDFVGGIYFAGGNGTDFKAGALIRGFVDATPSAGNRVPLALVFYTAPSGGSLTEALRIASDQTVNVKANSLNLFAGTTTISPLNFASGTNLTTAAVGACEFDGTCFYHTSVASARQVVDTEQVQVLSSGNTLVSNTSAQAIFNATANGAVTLAASTTYEFEMVISVSSLPVSSHSLSLGFGGTATFTSIGYWCGGPVAAVGTVASALSCSFQNAATAQIVTTANTNTGAQLYVRGTMRINAGGTVIPQITQNTASAAATINANSFFRCWPIGSNTVTNVGNWS